VPNTVLVDRYGKVVGRNLRGAELESKIEQLLQQEWTPPADDQTPEPAEE